MGLFTNVGLQVAKYEYISVMIFGFKKYKEALFLPYTYENTLSNNGTQALAIIDMELSKSSCDNMHWQQGKCYIHSWQFDLFLIAVDIMILSAIFVKIIWI